MGDKASHRAPHPDRGKRRKRVAEKAEPRAIDRELSTSQQEGIRRLIEAVLSLDEDAGVDRSARRAGASLDAVFQFTPKAGRYESRDTLAVGGMGRIQRVFDRDLWRLSAMKIALPEIQASPEFAARFITEGRITALLEHPNIVPVHDIGRDEEGNLFFTMKLVAGEPLSAILARLEQGDPGYVQEYPLHRLLLIFRKVCDAVAFAHSRGVIHRDIKPHNIMVGPFGEVLLMDWGLAKFTLQPSARHDGVAEVSGQFPGKDHATTVGVVKGTPSYMAPEQAIGLIDQIDEKTDIFLLGGTLFHILALRPPYVGRSADEIVLRAMDGAPSPLSEDEQRRTHDVPEELWRIVTRSMAPRREDRYACVEELIDDLDAWMAGRVLSAHRVFPPGTHLMRAGEKGDEAYVILRGRVRVTEQVNRHYVHLGELGPGEVVGEMALLTREPRSADVVAVEETEVEVISRETMRGILRNLPPWMDNLVTALARRLRAANARIHPLAAGDCLYSVLRLVKLLATERTVLGPRDEVVQEIARTLALSPARVQNVLNVAAETGLLEFTDSGVGIPDDSLFSAFLEHCLQERMQAADGDASQDRSRRTSTPRIERLYQRVQALLRQAADQTPQ